MGNFTLMRSSYNSENKSKINNIDHLFPTLYVKQTFIFMVEVILPLKTHIFKHLEQFGEKIIQEDKIYRFFPSLVKISHLLLLHRGDGIN